MDKENRILQNDHSLFQIFCQNCGKLLYIVDSKIMNPDKMIISHNCNHHICENCIKSNSCPICNKPIKIIDDIEDIEEEQRKEYLGKIAEKFIEIDRIKGLLGNIICNKKLTKTCINDCTILCPVCFEENEHEHTENECEGCVIKFRDSLFCKNCGITHMKKKSDHKIVNIEDLQANYLDLCEYNSKLIDENISKIEKDISELDIFLDNYKLEIKDKYVNIENEYKLIGEHFEQNNQSSLSDKISLVNNNIDYIDGNKGLLSHIKSEVSEIEQNIGNVEKDHISRHMNIKSYENKKAKDHWINKYAPISDNVKNLNNIKSKYTLKKLEINLYDSILDPNTSKNLNNYIDISFQKCEYDARDYHITNLQFKVYEEDQNDNE